jgi:hypothetical protein
VTPQAPPGAPPPAAKPPTTKPPITKPPITKPPTTKKPTTGAAAKFTSPPSAPPPAMAVAPVVPPLTPRPFILPRRRLVILTICREDAVKLCSGTPPLGDGTIKCLGANAASLSPTCYDAIARVSRQ